MPDKLDVKIQELEGEIRELKKETIVILQDKSRKNPSIVYRVRTGAALQDLRALVLRGYSTRKLATVLKKHVGAIIRDTGAMVLEVEIVQ